LSALHVEDTAQLSVVYAEGMAKSTTRLVQIVMEREKEPVQTVVGRKDLRAASVAELVASNPEAVEN